MRVVHVPGKNSASQVGRVNHWVEPAAGGVSLVGPGCFGCCVLSCGVGPLPLDGSCWLWSEREWSPSCRVGVLVRCLVPDVLSCTVTSILVCAGVGVDVVICTSVVSGPAPGKRDMAKLLLLALGVDGACLADLGVPGGVVFGLLMEESISWSGARVRSSCSLVG